VDDGYSVKVVVTKAAEVFFQDHGKALLESKVAQSDIYRDSDEWSFRYTQFAMPVRANHLALCDWADIAVVAPATCNAMGKIAHGIADNLLSTVFVAWQYQHKPAIFAPACNTHMWHNIAVENSVSMLKSMGISIVGPMEGILSNGNKGVGMMAPIDLLVEQVQFASAHLEDSNAFALHRALGASQSSNADMWRIVLRMIDEGVASIDACTETGDTMLHLLARGTDGISGVDASRQLLARGAKPDMINKLDERPLDLAVGQGSAQLCRVLLECGSDIFKCRAFNNNNNEMTSLDELSSDVRGILDSYYVRAERAAVEQAKRDGVFSGDPKKPYHFWSYGTYKRDFPNYQDMLDGGGEFVMEAETMQTFLLTMQKVPACSNPGCKLLHRQVKLYMNDVMLNPQCPHAASGRGAGPITGEIFKVSGLMLSRMDSLEKYVADDEEHSQYLRRSVEVSPMAGHKSDESQGTLKTYMFALKDVDAGLNEVQCGDCDEQTTLPLELAAAVSLKRCCVENPGHPGDHYN